MPGEEYTENEQVEGRNPVLEALRGPREVREVFLSRGTGRKGAVQEIISLCERRGIPVHEVSRDRLKQMSSTAAPQGVIALVSPFRYYQLSDLPVPGEGPSPLVLVLDGVEDPRNFGSLLRVADAAGADAVVIASRRSVGITPVAAKASAGAAEHVRVVRVSNIPSVLNRLKHDGYWVVGAESGGGVPYFELDLTVPLALVLGGEGRGLGRLVRERCDYLARLPMLGSVTSLNVSAAGAVMLYEAVRQRSAAGQLEPGE